MKKIYLVLIFSCISIHLKAQMYFLADTNFRNALTIRGYGGCIVNDSIDASCLGPSDTLLYIPSSNIQSLEGIQAFQSLKILDCSTNHLTSIPTLPNLLTRLDCFNNQLTSLPVIPSSLTILYCFGNALTNLPALPNSLTTLDCRVNQIISLPTLPASLTYFNCSSNLLTSLPPLPTSIVFLFCDYNQLTSLPALPDSLGHFTCSNNHLTSLPALPSFLGLIYCRYNQLTNIPALPSSLTYLFCDNNQLTSLPDLPDSLVYLDCDTNPNLNCLPRLTKIQHLQFSGTGITCLPNYGVVTNSFPSLSSIPLCDIFNANSCSFYWNINGRCFLDADSNCISNSGDNGQSNMNIRLYKNGNLEQQVFTGSHGEYAFDLLDTGNYVVQYDTTSLPFDLRCPTAGIYNDTLNQMDSLFYNNDFALKCEQGFDVGTQSIWSRFRPALNSTVHVAAGDLSDFYGIHCAAGISGRVTVYFTGPVNYVGVAAGSLIPAVSGDTLTYSIADFGTVNFFNDFNFVLITDTNATITSQVCITVVVSAVQPGDFNSSDDTLTNCFFVRNSLDPNEKEVYPPLYVDSIGDHWLTYTIQFQNTGTDTAQNIYILDTLDANLDLSTFHLLAYSHQPFVQILEGGIGRFNFPHINLPDSNTNEPASHGYVQYKIKLKDGLSVGTQVHNTGYIYFDFNSPVVTNTTGNTILSITNPGNNVQDRLKISVYPNPLHEEFTVLLPRFSTNKQVTLTLYDTFGQEIQSYLMTGLTFRFQMHGQSSGIYFLKAVTEKEEVMMKLVKN